MARGKSEGKVSKRKMVENAMAELPTAKPAEMREFIIQKHGVDISAQMISSYRSNLRRGSAGAARGAASPAAATTERGNTLAGLPANAMIGLRDLQAVRDLISRLGAPQLQSIIKLLSA